LGYSRPAARTEQHHELAVLDVELDVVDGHGLVEDLAHALQVDLGHRCVLSS